MAISQECEVFRTTFVQKLKTRVLRPVILSFFLLPEIHAVYEIMWKIWYSRTGHRWQCNTARALCMLHNWGCTHTHTHTHTHTQNMQYTIWWGKFSQKHNYKYMAKWWCLLAMEKLHVSAYSGHLQVLTTFLLKEFNII